MRFRVYAVSLRVRGGLSCAADLARAVPFLRSSLHRKEANMDHSNHHNNTARTEPIRLDHTGYRVARVTTHREMLAVARRRYQVFVEQMGALPANDGHFELDTFDAIAEHFYVSVDGVVIGCMRVVPDSPLGFPMEADGAVLLASLPRNTTAEASRVNAEHVSGHDVPAELIVHAGGWAAAHGFTHLAGVSNERALRSLRRQGWPVVTFGEPIDHAGTAYFPNVTCIRESACAAA